MREADPHQLAEVAERAMREKGFIPHPPPEAEAEAAHAENHTDGLRDLRQLPWTSIDNLRRFLVSRRARTRWIKSRRTASGGGSPSSVTGWRVGLRLATMSYPLLPAFPAADGGTIASLVRA